jgi:hypothetical protein
MKVKFWFQDKDYSYKPITVNGNVPPVGSMVVFCNDWDFFYHMPETCRWSVKSICYIVEREYLGYGFFPEWISWRTYSAEVTLVRVDKNGNLL